MVFYLLSATAFTFILLTATKRISTLRNAASSKIQEIDRSVENEIKEIKLHKEKLREERMNEIHTKLAEKIRQMLRDSYQKHKSAAKSGAQKSERRGHHSRPMSIGETPVKV
jgi:predicted Holliday junction resolvase-like endonuclease